MSYFHGVSQGDRLANDNLYTAEVISQSEENPCGSCGEQSASATNF